MPKLYDDPISGNGYKVRLLLNLLDVPFDYIPVDILKGETTSPEFMAVNPNGKIPCIEFEDGRTLSESNAIMWYFARDTPLVPTDLYEQASMMQWMFFEQYSHEPKIAVARFIMHSTDENHPRRAELPACHEGGYRVLEVMNDHLTGRSWFAGHSYSLADIALYAYTHVANEGGFDLRPYDAINAWLKRVSEQPRHILLASDH